MLSLLVATALLQGQQPAAMQMFLNEPGGKPARLAIWVKNEPLDPPKMSPKLFGEPAARWQFDWIASSFGPDENAPKDPQTGQPQARIRFRVFSQLRTDAATLVARQAIRMWDILTSRYRAGHNEQVNRGVIDYYLCFGGEAGGEQLIGEDIVSNQAVKVNTIYIYDIKSFTKPIEMAREVAHEYGHAVLPPVGGYNSPEYWANGYLGEKFFMRRLREQFAKKPFFEPNDVMGATETQMDLWVKQNVEPLVTQAASRAPSRVMLGDKGKVGMDAYIGLVLYADTIFPSSVVSRSMLIMGSQDARDYPDSLLRATQEMPKITLAIPDYLKKKPIWIPLGNGKVSQAQILRKSGDWAEVQPQAGAVVITTARA